MKKIKMASSKKILIASVLLGVLLLGAVITVVAVFAASQQSVSSQITVSYVVDDVGAKVSGTYATVPTNGAITKKAMTGGNNGVLEFRVDDPEKPISETQLAIESIELKSTEKRVVFEYRFENTAAKAFTISLTERPIATNMDIRYKVSAEELGDSAYRSEYELDTLNNQVLMNQNDVMYIYIFVTIHSLNSPASYAGDLGWTLLKVNEEDKVQVALNNNGGTGGLTSVTAVKGAAMPVMTTLPASQTVGQVFEGYYNGADKYVSADGEGVKVVTSAMTLTAEYKTVATVATTGENTTIANVSEEEIYVSTEAGTTFSYGGNEYTTNGEYLLINPEQSVTMTSAATAAYADSTIAIANRMPSDLSTKLFYSAYGEYPQTYVGDSLNTTLKSASLTATGKSYTTDINGTTTTLVEYEYQGKKYAKLVSSNFTGYPTNGSTFSTGDAVASNQTYFFAVEPILCKAMEVNGGKATMMTVEMLGSMAFDDEFDDENWEVFDNSWKNSDIREYLNGTFLNESGLSNIAQSVAIENKDPFGTCPTTEDTTDKIFLASAEEICKWTGSSYDQFVDEWGLWDDNCEKRQVRPSDMAMATYCYCYKDYNAGSGYYWLRSPGDTYDSVCYVDRDGFVFPDDYFNYADGGFCPAFVINL